PLGRTREGLGGGQSSPGSPSITPAAKPPNPYPRRAPRQAVRASRRRPVVPPGCGVDRRATAATRVEGDHAEPPPTGGVDVTSSTTRAGRPKPPSYRAVRRLWHGVHLGLSRSQASGSSTPIDTRSRREIGSWSGTSAWAPQSTHSGLAFRNALRL